MLGVKGKRMSVIIASAFFIIVSAVALYLDYKTDQLMAQTSGEIVEVLEPHVIEIPEESKTQELISESELPRSQVEEPITSDNEIAPASEQGINPPVPAQKPSSESSNTEANQAEDSSTEIVEEDATLFEKAQAYKLASSKLSAKEINELIQWSRGGFTESEKESAKSLFYSRFTVEEQQWILGLFKKYN